MHRKEVYERIDEEREYQEKWDKMRKTQGLSTRDKNATVESWILWMEEYLVRARKATTDSVNKSAALACVRKVTALGVACMEHFGAPKRYQT